MRHGVLYGHQVRLESAQRGAKAGRQVPQHRVPRARRHTFGQPGLTDAPVSGRHQAVYPRVSPSSMHAFVFTLLLLLLLLQLKLKFDDFRVKGNDLLNYLLYAQRCCTF